jgi:hypothetical protein
MTQQRRRLCPGPGLPRGQRRGGVPRTPHDLEQGGCGRYRRLLLTLPSRVREVNLAPQTAAPAGGGREAASPGRPQAHLADPGG